MSKDFKESVTAVSSIILACTALAALGFTWWQIDDFKESTKIQRLVEEVREFDSLIQIRKNLASSRLDKTGKLKPLDPANPPAEVYTLLNYFDHLGLLQKRGYLDTDDIWEEFGYWAVTFYADSSSVIKQDQTSPSQNNYRNFVRLAEELQSLDTRRGERSPSPQDITDFYGFEMKQPTGAPMQRRK